MANAISAEMSSEASQSVKTPNSPSPNMLPDIRTDNGQNEITNTPPDLALTDNSGDEAMGSDLDYPDEEFSQISALPRIREHKRGRRQKRRRHKDVSPRDLIRNGLDMFEKDIRFKDESELPPPRKQVKMLRKWIQTIDIYLGKLMIWRLHSRNRLFKYLCYPRKWAYEDSRKTKTFNWTGMLIIPSGTVEAEALLHFLVWLRTFSMFKAPASEPETAPPTLLDELEDSFFVADTLPQLLALHAARQLLDPVPGPVQDAADVVRAAIADHPHSPADLARVWAACWDRAGREELVARRRRDPAFVFPDRGLCVRAAQRVGMDIVDRAVDVRGHLDRNAVIDALAEWSRAFWGEYDGEVTRVIEESAAMRELTVTKALGARRALVGGVGMAMRMQEEAEAAAREEQERRIAAMGPSVVLEL